jgi:outer membrane protein OmpA-like peptidoglycan-associated protein
MKNILMLFLALIFTTQVYSQEFTEQSVWRFNILFETGKSDIQNNYFPRLDSLSNALQDSTFNVTLSAHTDNSGSDESNEILSKSRAEAIKNYLIQRGINDQRLKSLWKGEAEPISENDTEGGKAQNRRVTVEVFRRIYLSQVTSVVRDDSGMVVVNALVTMRSKFLNDSTRTDSVGKFTINVPYKQPAIIEVTAKDHFYDKQILNLGVFKVKIKDFEIAKAVIGKKMKIKDLNFYGDKAILLPDSKPNLRIILIFMRINPTYKIDILGHVNQEGFPSPVNSYEHTLSLNRAKMVYEYLIENGISAERMQYQGFSNWEMLYPRPVNDKQKELNRRVEIRILEK